MMTDMLSFQTIHLPSPSEDAGPSLFATLRQRRTIREISEKALPIRLISDLLWAACGVNRAVGPFGAPGSTAASASNSQEIDVYLATECGTFLYKPRDHLLHPVAPGDGRRLAMTPGQPIAATAPVQLVYVVDIQIL